MTPREELQSMVTGFRLSAALSVAAELGISDLLASGQRNVSDLASAVGADEDTLHRLLHALATVGIYREEPDRAYANTELGEGLRSDVPGSMRSLARTLSDPLIWAAWGNLGYSVRTGDNAFRALHGIDVWAHRERNPEQNAIFNDYMAQLSTMVAGAVAASYDFTPFSSVVDVGGGRGALLEAVLARNEHLRGTVFDLAHVAARAPSDAAPESVASRWSAATGSFFEAVPPADAYLLKSILHDWDDEECVTILTSCRRAVSPGGVVLVVEQLLDQPGSETLVAFSDLNMLVLPGGRERREAEYASLFEAAGLKLARSVGTGTRFSILEGVA
jgi:hypothetical protein